MAPLTINAFRNVCAGVYMCVDMCVRTYNWKTHAYYTCYIYTNQFIIPARCKWPDAVLLYVTRF